MTQVHGDLDYAPEAERTEFGAGRVAVDESICGGCTLCALICPARLLVMVGEGKIKKSSVREGQDNCMACGCCEAICETGAIKLTIPYDHGGKWKQLDRGKLSVPRLY